MVLGIIDIHTVCVYIDFRRGTIMRQRLNITLPEDTVRLMDRIAKKGDRSRLIAEAVTEYVGKVGRARLRKRLQEGALRRAERDLRLAGEWFALEEEAWPKRRG